ncbi:hypothetical protein [Maricaulis parjimensis]|uniref:hypothetical protein n=1 Tax=Maricaulis parjimensis TaxID=144023 RepID=UPI00193ABB22|nr:hypothetical protein [Maricaulis parjimensis]
MTNINPMNAVAMAFLVGRIRPRAFWLLLGWTAVWMTGGVTLQLWMQPTPPMGNGASEGATLGYMIQSFAVLPLAFLFWIIPFVAWMRLLTTGQDVGWLPVRFGAEELWALLVALALTLTVLLVPGVLVAVILSLSAIHQGFLILNLLFLPLGIGLLYALVRLTPAVALSAMTRQFAVQRAWDGMKGHVGQAFLSGLVIVVASFVANLVIMAVGLLVPALSLQQDMMQAMLTGDRLGLDQIFPYAAVSALMNLPIALLGYGMSAYFALAISGRDDDWTRAIASEEARIEAED